MARSQARPDLHQRFRQVVARGLERAEREERERLERLRPRRQSLEAPTDPPERDEV